MQQAVLNIGAICAGESDVIANMATIACELFHAEARFDWVGFYRNIGGGVLKIGPYQGGHGCLTIAFDRGVCGLAARERRVVIVDDVNAFAGHIACSNATVSEMVLPVFDGMGQLLGVLDIDSNQAKAFTRTEARTLQTMLDEVFATGEKSA